MRIAPLKKLIYAAILTAPALAAFGDLTGGGWSLARRVELPKVETGQLVYLPLDADILAQVEDFNELRVVQDRGRETPFRMMEERGQTERWQMDSRIIHQTQPEEERQQVTLDLGARTVGPLKLTFALTGSEFRCNADVAGSDDNSRWHDLVRQASLLRRPDGVEQVEIPLPANSSRYLRVTLTKVVGVVPRVERVDMRSELRIDRRLVEVPVTIVRSELAELKATRIELDTNRRSKDLVEARLEIADPQFDRRISVESSVKGGEWNSVQAPAGIKRLAGAGEITVPVDISTANNIRLTIYNGDSAPLKIKSASLWRFRRGIVFPTEPSHNYELWFGRVGAPPPSYDFAQLPFTTSPSAMPMATLGVERRLPQPVRVPETPPWSEQHPALFWGSLGTALVLLVGIIIGAMRGSAGANSDLQMQG